MLRGNELKLKRYVLDVRGKRKEWCFEVWVDPKYIEEWRADGLRIDELINTIPKWWVDLGLPVKAWCWMQDVGLVS